MFNRARSDDNSSHGTKFRTNPNETFSHMYIV